MCVTKKTARRTLTARGTWGDGVRVLKRRYWGDPMGLLQPSITMATVGLLHGAEGLLLVDTPERHGAEVVEKNWKGAHEWICEHNEIPGSLTTDDVLPVVGSCYHVLLVYELDTVDGAPAGRHGVKVTDDVSLTIHITGSCEIYLNIISNPVVGFFRNYSPVGKPWHHITVSYSGKLHQLILH